MAAAPQSCVWPPEHCRHLCKFMNIASEQERSTVSSLTTSPVPAAHVKSRQELWDVWLNSGCFSTYPATYLARHQHHIGMPIHNGTGRLHVLSSSLCERVIVGTGFNGIKSCVLFFFLKASHFKLNLCVDKSYKPKSLKRHLFFCISTIPPYTSFSP